MYVCTYDGMYIRANMYECMPVARRALYVRQYVSPSACVCVCMRVCTYVLRAGRDAWRVHLPACYCTLRQQDCLGVCGWVWVCVGGSGCVGVWVGVGGCGCVSVCTCVGV